ncbi:MAG: hypothetical protein ACTSPB_19205 [Candidatus Thorarchaeota archaeon]
MKASLSPIGSIIIFCLLAGIGIYYVMKTIVGGSDVLSEVQVKYNFNKFARYLEIACQNGDLKKLRDDGYIKGIDGYMEKRDNPFTRDYYVCYDCKSAVEDYENCFDVKLEFRDYCKDKICLIHRGKPVAEFPFSCNNFDLIDTHIRNEISGIIEKCDECDYDGLFLTFPDKNEVPFIRIYKLIGGGDKLHFDVKDKKDSPVCSSYSG